MSVAGINQQLLGAIFSFLAESDFPAACLISRACQQAMQIIKFGFERQLSLSGDQRLATFDARFGLNVPVREMVLKCQTECEGALNALVVPPAIFPGSADTYQLLKRYWDCLSLHLLTADEASMKRFVVFCDTFMSRLGDCSFSQAGAWVTDDDWAILRETEVRRRRSSRPNVVPWERCLDILGTDKQKTAEEIFTNQRVFLNLAADCLKNFLVQERVAHRYQKSFQPPKLSHTQKWDRFYSNQLAAAKETERGAGDVTHYLTHSQNRSPIQRFIRTEEIILSREEELSNDLELLCQALVTNGVPIPNGSIHQKRFWLHNNENQRELSRIEELTLTNFNRIPPEIGRLTGLKSLKIEKTFLSESSLTSLPPQLADLPRLSTLVISRSSFPVMPPILEQMPALSYLDISENTPPLRQISNALATKTQPSGLLAHLCGALGEVIGDRFGYTQTQWYSTYHYLGLDPQHLTDVPFFTWFRSAFSIPYLPVPFVGGIIATPLGLVLSPLVMLPVVGEWIAMFFYVILIIPLIVGAGLLTLAINSVILPLNLLINYGIEPLAQLCSPRMVHLQDAPAAP